MLCGYMLIILYCADQPVELRIRSSRSLSSAMKRETVDPDEPAHLFQLQARSLCEYRARATNSGADIENLMHWKKMHCYPTGWLDLQQLINSTREMTPLDLNLVPRTATATRVLQTSFILSIMFSFLSFAIPLMCVLWISERYTIICLFVQCMLLLCGAIAFLITCVLKTVMYKSIKDPEISPQTMGLEVYWILWSLQLVECACCISYPFIEDDYRERMEEQRLQRVKNQP